MMCQQCRSGSPIIGEHGSSGRAHRNRPGQRPTRTPRQPIVPLASGSYTRHVELGPQLHGAWRLTSYDDRESIDDDWHETYGSEPIGLAIYHPTGCLSMQISEADGSRFDAYFGRFAISEVSEQNGVVLGVVQHQVVASSMPEMLTADPTRPFRVSGTTLTLGDGLTWRRVFERVG
jgi:hypothetical protein